MYNKPTDYLPLIRTMLGGDEISTMEDQIIDDYNR